MRRGSVIPVVQYPQCVLKMYKLNAKPYWATVGPDDKSRLHVIWRTVHTVDARQRSRSSTDWIASTTTSTTPAERGVMLHNLQLHQAESGHAHLPASLSPHPPSEHRCFDEGDYRQEWPHLFRTACQDRVDSQGQAPRNARTGRHNSRLTTSCCLYCGLSSGGIDRYDACTGSVRHRQHGSMLHRLTS
jgi:hypothetical protein